jgi:hypothetical protein
MNGLAANNGLLFAWESPRRRQLTIIGFLAASAAGHAFCFYLFQIVYPPTVALLPPPARINLISNNSEEGRALLRWIEAEDPALASTTQRAADAKAFALPSLSHVPSYLAIQPALKSLPPSDPDLRAPSSQPPGPVPVARARIQSSPVVASTAIIFSKELDALGAIRKPPMKLTASSREPPQSAEFRVAVTDRGVVRYCFLQSSSGDTALDEQARHYLALCRFSGIQNGASTEEDNLNWAVAIIEWGNDIVTPPLASSDNFLP